jgi:hypothetical protein
MNEALGMMREVRMREVKGARAMGTGKPNMGIVGEGDHWATTVIHPNTTLVRHPSEQYHQHTARHDTQHARDTTRTRHTVGVTVVYQEKPTASECR